MYQEALEKEFKLREISFEPQVPLQIILSCSIQIADHEAGWPGADSTFAIPGAVEAKAVFAFRADGESRLAPATSPTFLNIRLKQAKNRIISPFFRFPKKLTR